MVQDDIAAVLEVIGQNFKEHSRLAARDFDQFFAQSRNAHHQYLVAEVDNSVVGCVGFMPDDDVDVEGVYWAVWFYVRPDHHQRGVGGRLWSELEARLELLQARKLYLDVGNDSEQREAIEFYLKRGFIKEGELIDYFRDGENKQIFAKHLQRRI